MTDLRLIKGMPHGGLGLNKAAINTVKDWRFRPAMLADGRQVPVEYVLTIDFSLD